VTVYLNRHAKAGDRDSWADDDRLRPLSGRGHLQARALADLLGDATFDRILSSPFVRCM
jgi:8-oxo-(d)GTP phosphatase